MYIQNGIAYASKQTDAQEVLVANVRALADKILMLTFNTGETKLYDMSELLELPAFSELQDDTIFANPKLTHGVVTWLDGEIDIAPETMYQNGHAYNVYQYA